MYPDLLGIFGIQLYGHTFETILWIVGIAIAIFGIVSGIRQAYPKKPIISDNNEQKTEEDPLEDDEKSKNKTEGLIQIAIAGLLLIWLAFRLFQAIANPETYQLFFTAPLTIHTYATAILIGVILGTTAGIYLRKRRGESVEKTLNITLILILLGFIGARLAYVIIEAPFFVSACTDPTAVGLIENDCLKPLKVWEGGLVFYGGVIAGMLYLAYLAYRKRIQILPFFDDAAPGIALAHAFGRIGCLGAGCCWGELTTLPVGISYPAGSFAYDELIQNPATASLITDTHTPLMHATQLYETLGELALFAILFTFLLKKRPHGQAVSLWLIGYGLWRFITEITRGDDARGYLTDIVSPTINKIFAMPPEHITFLSTSQFIAIIMISLGLFLFFGVTPWLAKRQNQHTEVIPEETP